jgi:hypothetical protein
MRAGIVPPRGGLYSLAKTNRVISWCILYLSNNKAEIMSTIRRRLNWHLANKKTSNSNNGPIADNEEP